MHHSSVLAAVLLIGVACAGTAAAQTPGFTEHEVAFESAPGITLTGTVSVPDGDGPFPAVVIASGSGAQDRDGGPGGGLLPDSLRMYRDLAHALTREGLVVLRFDDRGTGGSSPGPDPRSTTTLDLADDVEAAVGALAARPDVRWVGIVGHSEGGILAPIVAGRSDAVDGVVLVAATAERGYETILDQNRAAIAPLGLEPAQMDSVLAPLRELFEFVSADPDAELTETDLARARALFVASNAAIPSDKAAMIGLTPARVDAMAEAAVPQLTSRPFRTFLSLDPATYLATLRVSALGLFFELDQQVAPARNAEPMRQALGASASPDWEVTTLSGLNHVMQAATTGAFAEYKTLAAHIDPSVAATVAAWVRATAGE